MGERAPAEPRTEPFGDAAVLITLPGEVTIEGAARAQALARRIRTAELISRGIVSVVPAAASVLVHLDPAALPMASALPLLERLAADSRPEDTAWPAGAPRVDIPVRYGGDNGPDLLAVAEATGLTAQQVIDAHGSVDFRVLFLGFAPGFAYLGPLPRELVIPRRDTPRVRVPAGSVAIAGPYAAVYPLESPGGWHLLGRTDRRVWDPTRAPGGLLEPGSLVRFVPERS